MPRGGRRLPQLHHGGSSRASELSVLNVGQVIKIQECDISGLAKDQGHALV
jgi:hypothetical protein